MEAMNQARPSNEADLIVEALVKEIGGAPEAGPQGSKTASEEIHMSDGRSTATAQLPDVERLLDNAATASQERELLRDYDGEETVLREAVRMNVYEPMAKLLRSETRSTAFRRERELPEVPADRFPVALNKPQQLPQRPLGDDIYQKHQYEIEVKLYAAVEALKGIALRHADGSLCFDGCDKDGLQEPSPFCARYQKIIKDVAP
jgi:hypothetical protein